MKIQPSPSQPNKYMNRGLMLTSFKLAQLKYLYRLCSILIKPSLDVLQKNQVKLMHRIGIQVGKYYILLKPQPALTQPSQELGLKITLVLVIIKLDSSSNSEIESELTLYSLGTHHPMPSKTFKALRVELESPNLEHSFLLEFLAMVPHLILEQLESC